MKNLVAAILMLSCVIANAGDYFVPGLVDTYDPDSGLYFKSIERRPDNKGFTGSVSEDAQVLNINVFDPITGQSRLLFGEFPKGRLLSILFESGFQDGSVLFNDESYSANVKNNKGLVRRAPRDKILVSVGSNDGKESYLYVSSKRSGQAARIATVPDGDTWHIDVKNSKLRVVHQTGKSIRIESFEW